MHHKRGIQTPPQLGYNLILDYTTVRSSVRLYNEDDVPGSAHGLLPRLLRVGSRISLLPQTGECREKFALEIKSLAEFPFAVVVVVVPKTAFLAIALQIISERRTFLGPWCGVVK